MIKIDNISKKFFIKNNIVQALNNINLLIEENDCYAIVGESGSGKTTLANIILGIYKQDEGKLWFNDHELRKQRNIKQRKLIQYVQRFKIKNKHLNFKHIKFKTITSAKNIQLSHSTKDRFEHVLISVVQQNP